MVVLLMLRYISIKIFYGAKIFIKLRTILDIHLKNGA